MAHYPRGRDWDGDAPSAEGAADDGAPADGTPATTQPADSPPAAVPPVDSPPVDSPPVDPGSIPGWTPSGGSSSGSAAEDPEPSWPAPGALPAAPVANVQSGTGGPVEGWVEPSAAAPEAKSAGGIGGLVRRFWILGLIAVIAVGAFVLRDRLSGGAGDLQVGDCFDLPGSEITEVKDVQHHPCTEAHTGEVILVFDFAGGDTLPTDDQFFASIEEHCVPAFAEYTGTALANQETLDLFWLTPSSDGWKSGDREISCALYRLDEAPLTESLKGSNPT